jgi:hypothetical protein
MQTASLEIPGRETSIELVVVPVRRASMMVKTDVALHQLLLDDTRACLYVQSHS